MNIVYLINVLKEFAKDDPQQEVYIMDNLSFEHPLTKIEERHLNNEYVKQEFNSHTSVILG